MARMQISTVFKKWDLLVTLEGKYVAMQQLYKYKHLVSATYRVHSCCE